MWTWPTSDSETPEPDTEGCRFHPCKARKWGYETSESWEQGGGATPNQNGHTDARGSWERLAPHSLLPLVPPCDRLEGQVMRLPGASLSRRREGPGTDGGGEAN